jgi:transcriptional regulator with XRE-family HTH domain
VKLGPKIRDLRQRRGLTVQQLADASDLSKGFISQVENSRTTPSLATLQSIASALQTSVAYLVVEEERVPYVVRASERRHLEVEGDAWRVELLSTQPRRNLDLVLAELPPGVAAGDAAHVHHGEECVFVIEGKVRLSHGDEVHELDTGDTCQFDGRVPHIMENSGPGTARLLIAMAPAAFESPAPVHVGARPAQGAAHGAPRREPSRA